MAIVKYQRALIHLNNNLIKLKICIQLTIINNNNQLNIKMKNILKKKNHMDMIKAI